ncbi:MAG TPA: hypothetical protein VFI33_00955 [Puia sp.]|nr:hypothetical protein [Puia sp.]
MESISFVKLMALTKRIREQNAGSVEMPLWVRVSIPIAVGLFIFALAISAAVVPRLRLLHLLQALIYVAILILTRRNNAWGFGIAVFIAVAWNGLNLFVTNLSEIGARLFLSFLRTGHVNRPDTVMVFIGTMAHFLLIAASITGFILLKPDKKQWFRFFAGGVLVIVYMAFIAAIAAPR